MDQQVSPAVVIVVLILVLAIVVALYYLVVQSPAAEEGEDVGVPVGPASKPPLAEGEAEALKEETESPGQPPEAEGEAVETPAAPEIE